MHRFFHDLTKYKNYIKYATKAQLKSELAGSRLGWIWWILDPLLFMLIYLFVFVVVFQRSTEYLLAFIFLGSSLWKYFNSTVQSSVTLIKRNRHIISKVYVPKFVFVLVNMLCGLVKLAFSMIVVIVLMVYYRIPLSVHYLAIIPTFAFTCVLTFALSCWVMHFGVYFEDLANFVKVIFQLLFYASGVFYPIMEMLDKSISGILLWVNPAALILTEARNALLYGIGCDWLRLGVWSVFAVILAVLAIQRIYRAENQYVKII